MSQGIVRVVVVASTGLLACGSKGEPATSLASATASSKPAASVVATGAPASTSAAPATTTALPSSASGGATAQKPPPDGKYERVTVEGTTVPMIEVMDGGSVVLVDTDGKKPRTWEEQYKRKRDSLPAGSFDVHKVDANKNNKFDDDPIDKEGLWVIDDKGNITKH